MRGIRVHEHRTASGQEPFDDDHLSAMTCRAHPQGDARQRLHSIAIVRRGRRINRRRGGCCGAQEFPAAGYLFSTMASVVVFDASGGSVSRCHMVSVGSFRTFAGSRLCGLRSRLRVLVADSEDTRASRHVRDRCELRRTESLAWAGRQRRRNELACGNVVPELVLLERCSLVSSDGRRIRSRGAGLANCRAPRSASERRELSCDSS